MKTSKLAAAAGLVILSAGILAACSFGGSNSSGKTIAMFIRQIQIRWITLCPISGQPMRLWLM